MRKYFAGFIMTYERPDILASTIHKIFEQSLAPEKLIIVDNSESHLTRNLIEQMNDPRLEYVAVGYNAGPAGAAKIGLSKLISEGYDWIYWGDDDDPPRITHAFEILLSIPDKINEEKIGALGLTGNRFDIGTAVFTKIPNAELKGIVEVDSIAGNNTFIISGKAARRCDLPNPELFFGLEELDYCLSLRKGGFKLFVDGDTYYALRERAKKHIRDTPVSDFTRLSFDIRSNNLWREYYSIRNLIFLMSKKCNNSPVAMLVIIKSLVKGLISFRRGIKFGFVYSRLTMFAILDAVTGKMGKTFSSDSFKL
ncbi:glycosyltransferase [Chryseolinea sp. H1M3-3]|uniref:glycosyltransferase n=1 Tax=Chryseolinea sp. H1M3-3 TaxID=3034144 RepID=UPI0023EC59D7|nr:glycosyltransferase [Chryseolinea sp. H1M3-3]